MSIWDILKTGNAAPAVKPEYIIAGLGNPGPKYERTRHNCGFVAIDRMAEKYGVRIDRAKYQALIAMTSVGGHGVMLMKPQTLMNASGAAIQEAADFYKIQSDRIIVLCDDISLAPGIIRIRKNGSAGGHNGLKSIIACLGTDAFPRVKIGVGEKPNPEYDLADWVLCKIPDADRKAIDGRLDDIVGAVEMMIAGNTEQAMNLYNRKE